MVLYPILDQQGQPAGRAAVLINITARKRAEQERMLLVAAVEQTAEAVVIVGRDQTVEYANPAFSALVGLEAADRENLRAAVAPFLEAAGLKVKSIEDITPLHHNGCRPRKKRRV